MNLRIYVATQIGCQACEMTMDILKESVNGVPVYEVDLTSENTRARRTKMGVTATPTIFIVTGKDDNENNIWEEDEEKHLWHQTGLIADKTNLERYIDVFRSGGTVKTNL